MSVIRGLATRLKAKLKLGRKACRLTLVCWVVIACFGWSINQAQAGCSGLGCSCSVSTTGVAFGNYNPLTSAAVNSTGSVTVTCSALVIFTASYLITLTTGNSSSYASRFMLSAAGNQLKYNLYNTPARTQVLGDGTAGTATITGAYTAVGLTATYNYPVYGSLPALQTVSPGAYADIVTVNVVY